MLLKSINPYTNSLIGEFEEISDAELSSILASSSDAFKKWETCDRVKGGGGKVHGSAEVFGPVAPVTIVRDTDEAVTIANMTKFGLGISLFSSDINSARRMVSKFKDGAVFINDLVKSDPRLPFGGTGRSGYGR